MLIKCQHSAPESSTWVKTVDRTFWNFIQLCFSCSVQCTTLLFCHFPFLCSSVALSLSFSVISRPENFPQPRESESMIYEAHGQLDTPSRITTQPRLKVPWLSFLFPHCRTKTRSALLVKTRKREEDDYSGELGWLGLAPWWEGE